MSKPFVSKIYIKKYVQNLSICKGLKNVFKNEVKSQKIKTKQ